MSSLLRELLHFLVPLIGEGLLGILFICINDKVLIKYYNYTKESAYKISLGIYLDIMLVSSILWFIKVFLHLQFNIIQWSIMSVLIIELIRQVIIKKR
jgi:hypothetical protein